VKRHDQYCPIARTLDLLGDRWSMLVIRELSFGDAPFSALRRSLTGISPTLLTERLQMLGVHGLVAARAPAPSAARTAYTLTAKGRDALPILRAMARFGMTLLPSPRRARNVRPETAAHAAVRAFYDAAAAEGIDERYRLVLDGKTFDLASARGERSAKASAEPDLVLMGDARAVIAARRGDITLGDAIASGAIAARGSKRALRHFQRVYRLP
jgi:DNA-binding HxlR family transcriptional regulator